MRIWALIVSAAVAVGCVSGCKSGGGETRQARRAMGTLPQASYTPLKDYKLALRTTDRRIIHVGAAGEITYTLRNMDKKPIRIVEWFSNEPYNVIVYCQPWLTGMTKPDEEAWIPLSFEIPRQAIRYPLELMPGNQVLVTKKLPFVDKLAVSSGTERRFFLRAKLNLTSVSVDSPVSVLIVRPGKGNPAGAPRTGGRVPTPASRER